MKTPYVGPRAFRDGETLYGRGDDASRLFHLVLADRIVLLYSPSGAGKTSLLQAQLTPRLRDEDFEVFYDIRVNREPAEPPPTRTNRYLLSTILSIEKALKDDESRLPLATLASMSLTDYFDHVHKMRGGRNIKLAIFFDQFEEIFSLDPTDLAAKREFFRAVGRALEVTCIFAIFAMREDWIALLDEHVDLIPTRLRARQRLTLLTREQAVEAIRTPAKNEGVDFQVAEDLALDLSRMRIMLPDASTRIEDGPYVEPVQLQVVCLTLWDKPRRRPNVIDDLSGVSVDTSLADYYRKSIDEVTSRNLASERAVRDWFSRHLITSRGIRAQLLMDEEKTGELRNDTIQLLVDTHLVRKEQRGGRTWFELAHDRLVNPIRTSNDAWYARSLKPLQRHAREWYSAGQDPQLLLQARELVAEMEWINANRDVLNPIESAYIDASHNALVPIERAAIDWETNGRPVDRLLRGHALKAADQSARNEGEYHLSAVARAFLAESRAVRRQQNLRVLVPVFGFLLTLAGLGYAAFVQGRASQSAKLRQAEKFEEVTTKYLERPAQFEARRLQEAITAQTKIEELVESPKTNASDVKPIILYFGKAGDAPKVKAGLSELGFSVEMKPSVTPKPSNCLWYGSAVAGKDIKLIAYAIIRGGAELQGAVPLGRDTNVVQIGHNPRLAGEQPITAEDVEKPLSELARPSAVLITEFAKGTVKNYEPTSGQGIIARGEVTIPFRLYDESVAVRAGDAVAFVLYQRKNGEFYATNVRLQAPGSPEPTRNES